MLRSREGHQHEGTTSELDDEKLADKDANDNQNEEVVVGNVAEHIDVILGQLSRVEEIEDLQENERVKENAQMHARLAIPVLLVQPDGALHIKNLRSPEQDDDQNNYLENGTDHDEAPHLRSDDLLCARVGHAEKKLIGRRLSCQCESSQSVHNQVDPQHLNWSQGGLLDDDGSQEGHEDSNNVYGQLKLQELTNAIEDVSSVLDGSYDTAKVVVK